MASPGSRLRALVAVLAAGAAAAGDRGCARLLGVADARGVESVELHGARATARVVDAAGDRSQLDLGFFEDQWLVQGPGRRLESAR